MQLTAIVILGLYILQINAAAIAKRSGQISASASVSRTASVAQKSPMPIIDYNANKNYVPYQKLNDDLTLVENDQEEEEEENEMTSKDYTRPHHSLDQENEQVDHSIGSNKKYGVTHVGSRQHRYREGTSAYNPDPLMVVPMKQENDHSKPLPRRKQKNLIGVDDHGHVRHVVLDSNKDEKEEDVRRIAEKDIVAVDDKGEQHTMVVPMTMLPPKGRN